VIKTEKKHNIEALSPYVLCSLARRPTFG